MEDHVVTSDLKIIKKLFLHWRNHVSMVKYDAWCDIREDELRELECTEDVDPVHWCWNCKYGECERH
jgi:hypothetical protein